jgi:hypothetical protein
MWDEVRRKAATPQARSSKAERQGPTESTDSKGDGMASEASIIHLPCFPPQLTAQLFILDAVQPRHAPSSCPQHQLSVSYAARCSRGSTCASCPSCSAYCGPLASLMRCDHYRKTFLKGISGGRHGYLTNGSKATLRGVAENVRRRQALIYLETA